MNKLKELVADNQRLRTLLDNNDMAILEAAKQVYPPGTKLANGGTVVKVSLTSDDGTLEIAWREANDKPRYGFVYEPADLLEI